MKKFLMIILVLSLAIVSGCTQGTGRKGGKDGPVEIFIYNGLRNPENNQTTAYLEQLQNEKGITLDSEEWSMGDKPITELDGILKVRSSLFRFLYDNRHEYLQPINDILSSNAFTGNIPESIIRAAADED
ncbi:MAG: hypothetical protein R3232_06095, partial [Clostridia bacterium]|nr:hypothetical protein [Clostridia bacterium]